MAEPIFATSGSRPVPPSETGSSTRQDDQTRRYRARPDHEPKSQRECGSCGPLTPMITNHHHSPCTTSAGKHQRKPNLLGSHLGELLSEVWPSETTETGRTDRQTRHGDVRNAEKHWKERKPPGLRLLTKLNLAIRLDRGKHR